MKSSITFLAFFQILFSVCLNLPIEDVNLFLVIGNISNVINITWSNASQLLTGNYDAGKNTIIFTPDHHDKISGPAATSIFNAYNAKSPPSNFFVLDWSKYGSKSYVQAASSIPHIANYVSQNLLNLTTVGFDMEKLHLIGDGLGAHLNGYIGRDLQALSNITLPRITGLSPALHPLYSALLYFTFKPLNAKDAKVVDIIHTNSKKFDKNTDTFGGIEFYPNGGKAQPGCPSFTFSSNCSHNRAFEYYAESLTYQQGDKKFQSIKCKDYTTFNNAACTGTPVYNYMGYYVDPSAIGSFYLNTTSKSPYSL